MKKVLFLLHLPPPVHGSAMMGQQLFGSSSIRQKFVCRFVDMNTSTAGDQIGRLNLRKLTVFAGILWRVLVGLLTWKPDLVYAAITVTRGGFYKDFMIVLLLRLFRVRIVYHLHNKGVHAMQERCPYRWMYPFVFKNTDCILLSEHLYGDISAFVPRDRIHLCPNGIEDGFTDSRVRETAGLGVCPKILFLSNLIESKGVRVLVEACRILAEDGIAFSCDFVGGEGDFTEAAFSKLCIENDLQDRVKYLGKRYGADKDECYAAADIFAFPTYYHNETFGLVNLEAMQWSLPIISTREGGIPDVVLDGQTGYLVKQRDAEALAQKLKELLLDADLRRKMGEAGRQHYLNSFTSEHFSANMLAILLGLSEAKDEG